MNGSSNWHYAEKGKVIGPISIDEMKTHIETGEIKESTSVWNGEGDWQAASLTELAPLFIKPEPSPSAIPAPPPLRGDDIDNKFVWLLVATPLLGVFMEFIPGLKSVWVFVILFFVLNTVFYILDQRRLKESGHHVPKSKWIKVIPVYLWQRAIFLRQKNWYFWSWIGTFVLSIVLITELHSDNLEDSACPVVTQIMHESYGNNAASCKVVKIDKKMTDGFYKATAILDNGNEVGITIEELKDDQIEVRIVNTPNE